MPEDPFERVMRNVQEVIDRVGWNVIGVGGGPDSLPFAYTVGLTARFDHPELCLTGPWPQNLATVLLNTLGERVKNGERLTEGWYDDVISMGAVPLMPVTRKAIADNFGLANRYYRENGLMKPLDAFQMFLPDKGGRFSDDHDADYGFHKMQPKWCVGDVRRRVLN
jgi:hypothetical protein